MQEGSSIERRLFGRRASTIEAHVLLRGRDAVPCTVRNYSETGALLEFGETPGATQLLRLIIQQPRLEIMCQVRHRSAHGVGVTFIGGDRAGFADNFIQKVIQGHQTKPVCPAQSRGGISSRALRQALFGKSPLDSGDTAQFSKDIASALVTALMAIPEFSAAGFSVERNGRGADVNIYDDGKCRGQWCAADDGMKWSTPAGFGMQASSIDDAIRRTMALVLSSLIARRTVKRH